MTELALPLELVTEELYPRLSFSSLLSFLATSKSFYKQTVGRVKWLHWFDGDSNKAQKTFIVWAHRGIALEQLTEHLTSFIGYACDVTMEKIILHLRFYHPDAAVSFYSTLKPLVYANCGCTLRSRRYPFYINKRAFQYVRDLVLRIKSFGFSLEGTPETIEFGTQISRFFGYSVYSSFLANYLILELSLDDLMGILSYRSTSRLLPKLQAVLARILIRNNQNRPFLNNKQLQKTLGCIPICSDPFNRWGYVNKVFALGGLYCNDCCCVRRVPHRSTLNNIYNNSPHQNRITYENWMNLALKCCSKINRW